MAKHRSSGLLFDRTHDALRYMLGYIKLGSCCGGNCQRIYLRSPALTLSARLPMRVADGLDSGLVRLTELFATGHSTSSFNMERSCSRVRNSSDLIVDSD